MLNTLWDVIVVGGGHAGTEAALAASRMGAQTLLITHNIETLGQMSCNPAWGGIGKGHLLKEVDALGGIPALAVDHAGIQFRILNRSKGPAVRATRAQTDRDLYKKHIRHTLETQCNLTIFQQSVEDLILCKDRVEGVVTQLGLRFKSKSVVLTAGTFLSGKIHVGEVNYEGGRAGEKASNRLAARLREMSLQVGRLKTGTPPRIDGRTINFSVMEEQPGDFPTPVFSFRGEVSMHPRQVSCHITHTSEETHDIIRRGLHRSPMFSGAIEGVGPRYCPSIEDKVTRFSDKSSHQIFVEPEGLNTYEVYPNGISTSLPFENQLEFVRSIRGFERVHITRPGYAIEYDFFDPRGLHYSLQTKAINGLFFAGQVNGTTGYEEAAAQGLIAGVNAVLHVRDQEPWYPRRDEAYIGVLLDDLITQGTIEPYRMFTSRAEYRLLLREDNADLRLTEKGHALGLVHEVAWKLFLEKQEAIYREQQRLMSTWVRPETAAARALEKVAGSALNREYALMDLLRRPEFSYGELVKLADMSPTELLSPAVEEQIEIQAKYAGYIERQTEEIQRQRKNENLILPASFDYGMVKGLSAEVCQKLNQVQPETLGQASRISGVTPAAISILLVYLKKLRRGAVSDAENETV